MTTTDNADAPTTFGAKATGVKVGIASGENQNTFVYYKTLERTDGATATSVASATGRCEYTTIPNPFQVRPTYSVSATTRTFTVTLANRDKDNNWSYSTGNEANVVISFSDGTPSQTLTGSSGTVGKDYTFTVNIGTTVTLTFNQGDQQYCNYCTISAKYDDGETILSTTYGVNSNSYQLTQFAVSSFVDYRGFYKWRVKSVSGGTIYDASTGGNTIAAGGTIDAEQTVYFAPTYSTGMKVELEALWAKAYVVTSNTTSGMQAGVGYERNFMVLTSGNNVSPTQSANYQYTLTSVYPNGTSNGTNATTTKGSTTVTGTQSGTGRNATYLLTLSNNTKFEYVDFNMESYTMTAAGHNLVIGRGCIGTVDFVRGRSSDATSAQSYTIRLESGTFNTYAAIDNTARTHSSTYSVRSIFGSDYDRAAGDNSKLSIAPSGTVYGGNANQIFSSTSNRNNITYDWVIKSGKVQENVAVGDGDADKAIYLGNSITGENGTQYNGRRRITVEGGEMASIAGGVDCYGNYTTYGPNDGNNWKVRIRIKGGTVRGAIYGAAAYGGASYGRYFIFTGGTINGWVAGGCNGTATSGGQLYGNTYIYVGGNVEIGNSSGGNHVGGDVHNTNQNTYGKNGADGGNVFGAGCGILPTNASYTPNENYKLSSYTVGQVTSSHVVIADSATIWRDVYAGGNYGYIRSGGSGNIYILGGIVKGKVYGGSNNQQGQTVNITMKGGTVEGGLYGGSNSWGTINNNITMQIDGGQVGLGSDDTVRQAANIHGGGYGKDTKVSGTVNVTLGTCGATSGTTVYGDVYLGSALGSIGTGTTQTHSISLNKGTIYGGLYGGGLGDASNAAAVNGNVEVKVLGGSVLTTSTDPDGEAGSGSVFGCNNANGKPTGSVSVDIYGTDQPEEGYALHAVYGGGNKATYGGTPKVTIHGCDNSIEYVYGGGNASNVAGTNVTIWGGQIVNAFGGGNGAGEANPGAHITSSDVYLTIHGGTIQNVFGGSNEKGYIEDEIHITIDPDTESGKDPCTNEAYTECATNITNLYGGGNKAGIRYNHEGHDWLDQPEINLPCDIYIESFFGGSRAADYGKPINMVIDRGRFHNVFGGNDEGGTLEKDVTVTVYAGKVDNVYGGCNKKGNIKGTITVNIKDSSDNVLCTDAGFWVGNVYGGGYDAADTTSEKPAAYVNIINGTVDSCVYGGGYGANAVMKRSSQVTIGGRAGAKDSKDVGCKVTIGKEGTDGNVYGGGREAPVEGNPTVTMTNDANNKVNGSIFGGGRGKTGAVDAAKVTGNTRVVLKGGEVMGNVYGGGHLGKVDGDTKVELDE